MKTCKINFASYFCAAIALSLAPFCANAYAADATVQVQLNVKNAAPRAVESLTERSIIRDYRFAWTSMAQALELNTLDPLEGPFAGKAKEVLREAITS